MKKQLDTDPCRKCGGEVVRKYHHKNWKPKDGQKFWFEYHLRCLKCRTIYLVEEARVWSSTASAASGVPVQGLSRD